MIRRNSYYDAILFMVMERHDCCLIGTFTFPTGDKLCPLPLTPPALRIQHDGEEAVEYFKLRKTETTTVSNWGANICPSALGEETERPGRCLWWTWGGRCHRSLLIGPERVSHPPGLSPPILIKRLPTR